MQAAWAGKGIEKITPEKFFHLGKIGSAEVHKLFLVVQQKSGKLVFVHLLSAKMPFI